MHALNGSVGSLVFFLVFFSGSLNARFLTSEKNIIEPKVKSSDLKPLERTYHTFNFPASVPGGKTLLTGIRRTKDDHIVYISGFYKCPNETCVVPFVYKGPLLGPGSWNILNYPSSPGVTVLATNLYGPNNGPGNTIQVVGNYTTQETGMSTIGCLYQGPLDGSGTWTTLIPPAHSQQSTVINTIAHSTHGGIVVGNYDTQLDQGKAFIYDINSQVYSEIIKPNAKSITAYGVWHNGNGIYTIAGGYSNLNIISGVDAGYLVDWNNHTKQLSNWRSFNFDNDPIKAIVTHFDGITSDRNGGYYLTGDWLGVTDGPEFGFFAHVKGNKATWSSVSFGPDQITSGNSVYRRAVIGVYTSPDDPLGTVNGYVSFSH